jgi:hypothetical protein
VRCWGERLMDILPPDVSNAEKVLRSAAGG